MPLLHLPASLAIALAMSLPTPAQQRSAWATLTLPNGVLPADVTSIGKLTACRDGAALHVFSACQREWRTLGTSGTATLRITNDCLLVQDGSVWHGLGSHRGTFEALPVSPQARLLNAAGHDNDSILLVQDGNQLHAFSGFTGTWVTRPVTSAFGWSTQRHVAILTDGNLLAGMDAYSGQWSDLPVSAPPLLVSTDGTAGLAFDAAEVHAFSAMFGTWTTAPAIPGATFVRNDDWALFYDGSQMLAYSGTQGRFEHAPLGATAIAASEDTFALVDTIHGLVAFSAIRGSFSAPIALASARVRTNVAVATLAEPGFVHGYSAATNTFATLPLPTTSEEAAGSIAYAIAATTGLPHCFSGLQAAWYAPPANTLPGAPLITTTCALLPTTTGASAFSARSGHFVPLGGAGLSLIGNSSSAIGGAYDGVNLHAFDARTDRWSTHTRSSSAPLILQIWRTAMFAIDGTQVVGYGAQEGVFAAVPMPGAYVIGRANSESSRIVTSNHVLAHTAVAELTSYAQFPEFRRVHPAGAVARLSLPLGAGDFAIVAGGVFGASFGIPGMGTLWLDPGSLVSMPVLPAPGAGRAVLSLPVPPSPHLVGSEWGFQALVVPANRAPYLTGAAALLVL